MANTNAAKKAMRASARRAVRNRSTRSAVKTRVTRFRRATTTETGEQVTDLALTAIASLDRAASKGILHANNAARRKSRLQKRLNAALAGTITAEPTKGTRGKATAERSAAAKAEAAKSGAAKSGAAKSGAAKSGAAKTAASKTAKPAKAASAAKKPAARKSPKASS